MGKQSGKAAEKSKDGKRLKVKKQPVRDLEARKVVKAGARKRPGTGILYPE